MSLRNKFGLKLPFKSPATPQEHERNNTYLTQWANDIPLNERVRASVRRTSNQAIAANTVVEVQWQAANEGTNFPSDPYGFWNTTVNSRRLVCPQGLGGLYFVEFAARFDEPGVSSITTNVIMGIRRTSANGTFTMRRRHELYSIGFGSFYSGPLYTSFSLLPDEYVTAWVYHESGAQRSVVAQGFNSDIPFEPQLILTRISA